MVTPLQAGYLRLFRRPAFSAASFARTLRHFGSLAAVRRAADSALLELGLELDAIEALRAGLAETENHGSIEQAGTWLSGASDRHLVCFEDRDYPPLLRETASPPPLLYVAGDCQRLSALQVAIVGSRKASQHGAETAFWLARELAGAGFSITSGLAAGIDSQAHRGALAGGGETIAVLGTGIDVIYPARNARLTRSIVERGALVSELPLGSPPIALHFPQRNRIIAGLSVGVVVVEAALRSGSLITARLAMEENREVFAVPGSIHSPNARGCHRLIRDGAKLVDSVDSILEELTGLLLAGAEKRAAQRCCDVAPVSRTGIDLSPDERSLMDLMGFDPCTQDWLAEHSGLEIERVTALLSSLTLKGVLTQESGRYRCLVTGLQPSTF